MFPRSFRSEQVCALDLFRQNLLSVPAILFTDSGGVKIERYEHALFCSGQLSFRFLLQR